jgi:hypothetical protein
MEPSAPPPAASPQNDTASATSPVDEARKRAKLAARGAHSAIALALARARGGPAVLSTASAFVECPHCLPGSAKRSGHKGRHTGAKSYAKRPSLPPAPSTRHQGRRTGTKSKYIDSGSDELRTSSDEEGAAAAGGVAARSRKRRAAGETQGRWLERIPCILWQYRMGWLWSASQLLPVLLSPLLLLLRKWLLLLLGCGCCGHIPLPALEMH